MGIVKIGSISVSLDGFSAGPSQSLEAPLGIGGEKIFDWFFPTDTFMRMHADGEGEKGIDNDFAARSMAGNGAWILGRNMFGPIRGPWPDDQWKGWWGEDPPYHVPAFVLTHYPRDPIVMKGGTTFHFVTDGIESALRQARAAAGDANVRIGGGVSTLRQFITARLVDEIHLATRPVVLGQGESLFNGLDLPALGYQVVESTHGERATHVIFRKEG